TIRGIGADTTAFSVLWNNADLDNNKLFVEIMYDRKTCFQDAAEFWLCKEADGEYPFNPDKDKRGRQVPIDSVLNNQDNCVISKDLMTLSHPTAGGYRLRFQLDPSKGDTVVAKQVRIYVVSKYQRYFVCDSCGAAKSRVTIDSASIHPNCPYDDRNLDLLACNKRTGGANNWEAFVVDHRDCKIYRAVSMPHIASFPNGRWWFAQNLDYRKNLIMNKDATTNGGVGYYWCPGALSFDGKPYPVTNNATVTSGKDAACNAYGALYDYKTLMSRNGLVSVDATAERTDYSYAQGICPKGWVVPARLDWGVMLNKVVGCDDQQALTPVDNNMINQPCYNYPSSAVRSSGTYALPNTAVSTTLRSTLSSRPAKRDSIYALQMSPLWSWWRVGSRKAHGARPIDYYGFSILPSGGILGDRKFSQVGVAAELALASNERLQLHYANQNTYASIATASSVRCVHNPQLDGTVDKNKYMITLSTNFPDKTTVDPSGERFGSLPTTVKTATANDTLRFDGWFENGTLVHSTPNYPFVVTGPRTLEARYAYIGKLITISTNQPNKTTVDPSGDRIEGTSVTIKTATTNDTLRFDGWYEGGNKVYSAQNYPFVVIGPRTLEARYIYIGKMITISTNYPYKVTVDPSGDRIAGRSATIKTASTNDTIRFDGWFEGGTLADSSQNYTFTVTEARTLEARYTYVPQKITITSNLTNQVNKTEDYIIGLGKTTTVTTSASSSMLVFDGWYENNIKVYSGQTYPFTVTGDHSLEARYTIDYTHTKHPIPDANFRAYVDGLGRHIEGYTDAGVTYWRVNPSIASVTSLNVTSLSIANMTGIELFTGLTSLYASGSNKTFASIDLSKNTKLQTLQVYNNTALTALDVSKNTLLTNLQAYNCRFSTLNVSANTNLQTLYVYSNP
ncbi:MAG: FISUMP domain-containing protein, partial [Bacteroidales bacterium]